MSQDKFEGNNEAKISDFNKDLSQIINIDEIKDHSTKTISCIPEVEGISLMILNLECAVTEYFFPRIVLESNFCIQLLKSLIACQLRMDMSNFDVSYLGEIIIGGSLEENKITDNCSLMLKARKNKIIENEQFIIKIKNETNESLEEKSTMLIIDEFQSVEGLKLSLRGKYNVSIAKIKLFLDGNELKNKDIIRQLDIENGATLTLILEENKEYELTSININVKNCFRENEDDHLSMCINTSNTVAELIRKIECNFDLSSVKFVISFCGDILKNENMLSVYDIKDEDQVLISKSLLIRYYSGMDGASSRVNRYPFKKEDKVSDLKLKIKKNLNIEPIFINLNFNGSMLEDHEFLDEYGIENESYLMMIATLAGGN